LRSVAAFCRAFCLPISSARIRLPLSPGELATREDDFPESIHRHQSRSFLPAALAARRRPVRKQPVLAADFPIESAFPEQPSGPSADNHDEQHGLRPIPRREPMSFFGKIFNKINPVKLAVDLVGGTIGKALRIATTVVEGIASGRKFGDILKDVGKQVAVLAVEAAITYFTGGTAGLFINKVIYQAQGILGKVAAKVAASTLLSKTVTQWAAKKITDFSASLTTDLVRKQLTDLVVDTLGLKDAQQQLERNAVKDQKLAEALVSFFAAQAEKSISEDDRSQTVYSLDPNARVQFTDGFDA
jgi:hypothetical protein